MTPVLQAHPVLQLPSSTLEATDPFYLTSFALALLLAFRLDASYSRFMEGRSIWGNVVYDSRNIMRQVSHLPAPQLASIMHPDASLAYCMLLDQLAATLKVGKPDLHLLAPCLGQQLMS